MIEEKEIVVIDLGAASALVSTGSEVIELRKTEREGQRAFVFKNTKKAGDAFDKYLRGELMVNAFDFYNGMKDLKSILFKELGANRIQKS